MCGVIGGWWRREPEQIETRMAVCLAALAHGGPDDRDHELQHRPEGTVALGHTRLATIDLSAGGHQPMY